MLDERKQIPELHFLKHRHDDSSDYIKYDENILDKNMSSYLYNNNIMNNYLKLLQTLISIIFDHTNVIKNFKNYIVDRDDYKNN